MEFVNTLLILYTHSNLPLPSSLFIIIIMVGSEEDPTVDLVRRGERRTRLGLLVEQSVPFLLVRLVGRPVDVALPGRGNEGIG
jgi:hypothetical protein